MHIEAANPQSKVTKAPLLTTLQNIAHGLRYKYGVGSEGPSKDTVTVITHGQLLVPAAFFGVVAAGGVYSAASPSSTISELARQVKIGQSKLIICGTEHIDVASKAAQICGLPLQNVLVLDSMHDKWSLKSVQGDVNALSKKKQRWRQVFDPAVLKSSLIAILWSSGTTGLPKGVMLSHANLVAETYIMALCAREWVAKEVEKRAFEPKEYNTLAHLPTSHIAGLFGYIVFPLYSGGTVYWMRKYEWNELLKSLKKYKITAFYTVPSIWLRISKSTDITDHFQHVEGASTGAAPMDSKLQQTANNVWLMAETRSSDRRGG